MKRPSKATAAPPAKPPRKARKPKKAPQQKAPIDVEAQEAKKAKKAEPKMPAPTALVRNYQLRVEDVRMRGRYHYVTDAEQRGVEWWYENGIDSDPDFFKRAVSWVTFRQWSKRDQWPTERIEWWKRLGDRIIEEYGDLVWRQRVEELEELGEMRGYLAEYLKPCRDPATGAVVRYPHDYKKENLRGLPRYPLPLGNMEKIVKALLDLDSRIMLKRGEVTSRKESVSAKEGESRTITDPVGQSVKLSEQDVYTLSKKLLEQHQPGLAEDDVEVPDEDEESGDGNF